MNNTVTEQEIKNVKQYNATLEKLNASKLAWEIAKTKINKAKRCYVWTRAFTDGDGVYVRIYKKDLLQKLDFRNHAPLICNDYKIVLREDGDLYID